MIVIPPQLPSPIQDGYGYQRTKVFERTEMDSGQARHRRRFKRTPTTFPAKWIFNSDQLALFEAWAEYELPAAGAWWQGRVIRTGIGMSSVKARFTNPEQPYAVGSFRGGLCQVTAQLETMALPIVSLQGYEALKLGYTQSNLVALMQTLYIPVNVTLPGIDQSPIEPD